MVKLDDVRSEGSSYEISLSKLTGVPIKELHGYLSSEFGEATFKLTRVEFVDGSELHVEGEHDCPYLTSGQKDPPNFDQETLSRLKEEGEAGE